MTASKIEIHKVCEYCGKTFVAWKSTTRFCSKTCNSRAYKQFRREQRIVAIENETNTRPIEKIRDKTIMSPKEVAVLLGLFTRKVYYLITRVRDNILKSKEQKNIQPTKGGHKMVTCQNYVSLFYCHITSCPSDGGIS